MEQVPEKVKDERLARLQKLLFSQQNIYNQQFEGQTFAVLFDRKPNASNKKSHGQMIGRSPYLQSVVIEDPEAKYLGKMVDVKIIQARPSSLMGEVVN
jgi:tRNA-2-methylthio-N6-dimethylallyladenosine synthase